MTKRGAGGREGEWLGRRPGRHHCARRQGVALKRQTAVEENRGRGVNETGHNRQMTVGGGDEKARRK